MTGPIHVVHYVNQFFGGLGGEEKAGAPVQAREGPVGPGRALQQALGGDGTVVATIIAGDNYMAEERETALAAVKAALQKHTPNVVIAGPAFDSGRYGLACAEVCRLARSMGIPAVTAMTADNAGFLTYRRDLIAVPTTADVAEMRPVLARMAALALKLGRGGQLGPAAAEGYMPTGLRKLEHREQPGYVRAVEMLKARMSGAPWASEVQVKDYERVPPAPPVADFRNVTFGLVSTGGLVPRGNPDRQVAARAEFFKRYSIQGLTALSVKEWESVHGGFGTQHLNTKNPNWALPLPALRELEARSEIRGVYPYFFSTTGNGTAVRVAQEMGRNIAKEMKEAGVGAAFLVAT